MSKQGLTKLLLCGILAQINRRGGERNDERDR